MGKDLMMVLVIQKSNVRFVRLTCENFGECRSGRKKGSDSEEEVEVIRDSHSKKSGCTFELCGYRLKKKSGEVTQKWILKVIDGCHNHKLPTSFIGHPYMGRMTPDEERIAKALGETFVTPRTIVGKMRKFFPGNVTSMKQVSNFLQKMHYEDCGEMTITQWTLNFLQQNRYSVFPLRNLSTGETDILFFLTWTRCIY